METYQNLSGQSGVAGYQISHDHIVVEFKAAGSGGAKFYKYSYVKPGKETTEHLKTLARAGRGLNSYISSYVRKSYKSKW